LRCAGQAPGSSPLSEAGQVAGAKANTRAEGGMCCPAIHARWPSLSAAGRGRIPPASARPRPGTALAPPPPERSGSGGHWYVCGRCFRAGCSMTRSGGAFDVERAEAASVTGRGCQRHLPSGGLARWLRRGRPNRRGVFEGAKRGRVRWSPGLGLVRRVRGRGDGLHCAGEERRCGWGRNI
jgi:hypothetical protein